MPDKEDNYLSERQALELQKLEFDREKSELEVRDLKRPWYRKPQYVLAALPTTLALIGILAGIYTGYFREKINKQQEELAGYEKQKGELVKSNEKSQETLKDLEKTVNQLNKETSNATGDLKQITNEKNTLLNEQRALARQVGLLNTDRVLSQSELQRIKDEYARIDKRSEELKGRIALLETDVSTADIKSLTELWLGADRKEEEADVGGNIEKRRQIVSLFSQRPLQQKQYISFFETYLSDPKVTPDKYISVASVLLELTGEPKWKKALVDVTLGYLRAMKTDRDTSFSALSRISELENLDSEPIKDELQAVVLDELETSDLSESNIDSVLWLFFENPAALSKRGMHRLDPELYLRVSKLAREVAIGLNDYDFRKLRRYSTTTFLAVIAYLIQNQKAVDIEKNFSHVSKPTRPMTKLEVPVTKSLSAWKSWADKPQIKRLVQLWFETDFATFKSNPDLLNRLVEEGEVN